MRKKTKVWIASMAILLMFDIVSIFYFFVHEDNPEVQNVQVVTETVEDEESEICVYLVEEVDEPVTENWYTDEEFDLLCRLVMAEGGSNAIPDEAQQGIAAVVVNRTYYPDVFSDTIQGVIYQEGQYSCSSYLGSVEPTERVVDNVRKVLDGEVEIPEDVVWQAGFPQSAWGTEVKVYAYYDTEPYDTWLCHWGV